MSESIGPKITASCCTCKKDFVPSGKSVRLKNGEIMCDECSYDNSKLEEAYGRVRKEYEISIGNQKYENSSKVDL